MKITRSPREPKMRNPPIEKMLSELNSTRDLHRRLGPAVENRGYISGLFRPRAKCPIKSGALRMLWLNGRARGQEARKQSKEDRP